MLRGRKVIPPTSSYGLRGAPVVRSVATVQSPSLRDVYEFFTKPEGRSRTVRDLELDHQDLVRRGVADPDPPVCAAGQGVRLGPLDTPLVAHLSAARLELVDVAVVRLHHVEGVVRLVPVQPVRARGGE